MMDYEGSYDFSPNLQPVEFDDPVIPAHSSVNLQPFARPPSLTFGELRPRSTVETPDLSPLHGASTSAPTSQGQQSLRQHRVRWMSLQCPKTERSIGVKTLHHKRHHHDQHNRRHWSGNQTGAPEASTAQPPLCPDEIPVDNLYQPFAVIAETTSDDRYHYRFRNI